MADEVFRDPRLAGLYDALDPDRSDLEPYLALARDLRAHRVLDVGCGTGTFALLLAARGHDVVGVDPAAASVEVARSKAGAERVRWVDGDATAVDVTDRDLVTMTANVSQAIADPDDWATTLTACHRLLRDGGHLVFETRDPAARAWESWTAQATRATRHVVGIGAVTTWTDLLEVDGPLVTFAHCFGFASDGSVVRSVSTLRFRTLEEIEADLGQTGFTALDVRDAPDRPGLELVVLARKGER